MIVVRYLKRSPEGFLPGSTREVIQGKAIDLVRYGVAEYVDPPQQPKPKRKRKRSTDDSDDSVDTNAERGTGE